MNFKDTTTDTLPAIPKTKHGLVDAGRRGTRSPHCFEDSGLDLRESLITSRPGSSSIRAGSAKSPPGFLVRAATVPLSPRPQSPLRRSLESLRLSRSELDRREHAVNSLRTENIQLQATIRELESCRECHTVLQSACSQMGQLLGCSMEGVAAESVREILTGKVTQLKQDHQRTLQQLSSCRSELEGTKGELAAANVKVTILESQLEQGRETAVGKETQIRQLRSELERMQQSSARSSTTLQSLRQQLAEAEERKQTSSSGLAELQTEIGRLRKELRDKDGSLKTLELQLSAKQEEQDSLQERTANSDAAYADLCSQLASTLSLEPSDSLDGDYLLSQVSSLVQECHELRMRVETMTKSIKSAELDSKASRETILRLVSESKKHEQSAAQITELQQTQGELKATVLSLERERDGLQERLAADKETHCALEQELQAKEARLSELGSSLNSLRTVSESQKEALESAHLKFENFCKGVAMLVGVHSTSSVTLLQKVEQLAQDVSRREEEMAVQTSQIHQLQSEQRRLQEELVQVNEVLEQERATVKQLDGELVTVNLVKQGMSSEMEKHKLFYRKLARSLQLDTGTAEILSGEFAEEAILVKAEQLTRHETQALAERQSAVYSLQRKLKACRQGLESKELHLGLLQKKVAALEERLQTCSHREADWEATTEKAKRMERQLKQVHERVVQQRESLCHLKAENLEMQRLRSHCAEQESQIARLTATVEELTQARLQQSRQLADARQQAYTQERSGGEGGRGKTGRLEEELRTAQHELEKAKEREKQLCTFRTAVQQLLRTEEGEEQSGEEAPTDYDLIAKLESMSAAQQRHKETAKCLEASLKQLEVGFKTGYKDALTLLGSDT